MGCGSNVDGRWWLRGDADLGELERESEVVVLLKEEEMRGGCRQCGGGRGRVKWSCGMEKKRKRNEEAPSSFSFFAFYVER